MNQNFHVETPMAIEEVFPFNPGWIFDPAIWKIADQSDREQVAAVVAVQLQLASETLAAQAKAVEALKRVLAPTP